MWWASIAAADYARGYQRESEGDESQMNGRVEVAQEGDGALPPTGTEAKCIVRVVEGVVVTGNSDRKMSLLWGLILASVHFGVMKTASNTLHVKGGKENECGLLEKAGMRRRAGGISFISISLTVKGDIIREKAISLPSLSLSFSTCTFTQLPSQSHSLSLSLSLSLPISDFLFFMLHNGILRNLHPPSYPSSSSRPLSPIFSSPLLSLLLLLLLFLLVHFLPLSALSLTFHFSLSHYSKGATMLWSWPSVMAHGLSGWEIANVAQMKY